MEEVRIINERFASQYGRHTIKNLPNFRLVFADDQLETRAGTFNVYSGDIFLREEVGIREVKKYSYLDKNAWVVERLIANHHPDVFDGDYIYEPIYSFKIFPIWRACEFLIQSLFVPRRPTTEAEEIYKDDQKKEKEKAYIRNLITGTALSTTLNDGSATSFTNDKGIDYRPSKQLIGPERQLVGEVKSE